MAKPRATTIQRRQKQIKIEKNWLEKQYLDYELTTREIAKIVGCHFETVRLRLIEYQIPLRVPGKTRVNITKEWLYKQYYDNKIDAVQIAKILGCHKTTIYLRLDEFGISRRTISETRKISWKRGDYNKRDQTGSKHPNWQGGISFTPYPSSFNDSFKHKIRERDKYSCIVCKMYGKDVHHVNYEKDDTTPENCTTLCRRCHMKTHKGNTNKYWKTALVELIEARNQYTAAMT